MPSAQPDEPGPRPHAPIAPRRRALGPTRRVDAASAPCAAAKWAAACRRPPRSARAPARRLQGAGGTVVERGDGGAMQVDHRDPRARRPPGSPPRRAEGGALPLGRARASVRSVSFCSLGRDPVLPQLEPERQRAPRRHGGEAPRVSSQSATPATSPRPSSRRPRRRGARRREPASPPSQAKLGGGAPRVGPARRSSTFPGPQLEDGPRASAAPPRLRPELARRRAGSGRTARPRRGRPCGAPGQSPTSPPRGRGRPKAGDRAHGEMPAARPSGWSATAARASVELRRRGARLERRVATMPAQIAASARAAASPPARAASSAAAAAASAAPSRPSARQGRPSPRARRGRPAGARHPQRRESVSSSS